MKFCCFLHPIREFFENFVNKSAYWHFLFKNSKNYSITATKEAAIDFLTRLLQKVINKHFSWSSTFSSLSWKNLKESKLEFWDFGWNCLIFNKIWKIEKLGDEIKPKFFNPSIFVKRNKWARKWYNIPSNTMCNKKVIKLNNFENFAKIDSDFGLYIALAFSCLATS